jgi:DNA-directed RNA polymerase subunit RPC12/RpoP
MNLQENIERIKEVMGIQSEEKESGEKFIKCVNCKKKFTQTIHKGKKSLPICPYCGTHNDSKDKVNESKHLRRRVNIEDVNSAIEHGLEYVSKHFFNAEMDMSSFIDYVISVAIDKFHHKLVSNVGDYFPYDEMVDFLLNRYRDKIVDRYNKLTNNDMMSDSDVKQEQNESELTERCWKGYTQKGMKTMFGKRYPNCVKKKK